MGRSTMFRSSQRRFNFYLWSSLIFLEEESPSDLGIWDMGCWMRDEVGASSNESGVDSIYGYWDNDFLLAL